MEGKQQKWKGLVSAELNSIKPDQAWSLLGDFCSLHKFLPLVATCRKIDGPDNAPGCLRYCETEPDGSTGTLWAKERLVTFDAVGRSFSYVIVENNMGLESYFATFRVVECGGDDGCKIEWMFEAEPVDAWTEPGLVAFLEDGVREMAKSVGDALRVGG